MINKTKQNKTKQNRFKPIVTRIKLNPEQAVLTCDCYLDGNITFTAAHKYRLYEPRVIVCKWGGFGGPRTYYTDEFCSTWDEDNPLSNVASGVSAIS